MSVVYLHSFCFLKKLHKGQSSPDGPQQRMGQPSPKKRQPDRHTPNFETTFDVQGHIDTKDGGVNPRNDDRQRGMEELQRRYGTQCFTA